MFFRDILFETDFLSESTTKSQQKMTIVLPNAQTLTNSGTFPINEPQHANVHSYDEVQLKNNENVSQRSYEISTCSKISKVSLSANVAKWDSYQE